MSRRIILWDARLHSTQSSDEAGTSIIKSTLPPPIPTLGPYESTNDLPHAYVPSLAYFALKKLVDFPDQVHVLGSIRLPYHPPSSALSYDILRELIPNYDPTDPDSDLTQVDPRLWATLIQVYYDLPDAFRTYRIPLSDKHVLSLQRIPSSDHFSLITILDLPDCLELTDETIIELKHLSGLSALDASGTTLSAHGIKGLSRALMWSGHEPPAGRERRGPWGLRILNLRNCVNVDSVIFSCLSKFLLLSVVDLRGTRCDPSQCNGNGFRPTPTKSFFYPSPLSLVLDLLSSASPQDSPLFSSPDPYILHITSLHHKPIVQYGYSSPLTRTRAPKPSVNMQDAYVVLPASQSFTGKVKNEPGTSSGDGLRRDLDIKPARIKVGNSETLARMRDAREEMARHERNKEAWYERNERVLEHGMGDGSGYEDPMFGYEYGNDYDEGGSLRSDEDSDCSDALSEDMDDSGFDDSDDDDSDGMDLDVPLFSGPQADTSAATTPHNSDPPDLPADDVCPSPSPTDTSPKPEPTDILLQSPTPAEPQNSGHTHPSSRCERRRSLQANVDQSETSPICAIQNIDSGRGSPNNDALGAEMSISVFQTPVPAGPSVSAHQSTRSERRRLQDATGQNEILPKQPSVNIGLSSGKPRRASSSSNGNPSSETASTFQEPVPPGPASSGGRGCGRGRRPAGRERRSPAQAGADRDEFLSNNNRIQSIGSLPGNLSRASSIVRTPIAAGPSGSRSRVHLSTRHEQRRPIQARAGRTGTLQNRPIQNNSSLSSGQTRVPSLDNSHCNSGPVMSRPNLDQPLIATSSTAVSIIRPAVPQPMRRPSVDIQVAVAQEEAEIEASRHAAATFYMPMPAPITSHRIYQDRRAEGHFHRGDDERLMLFREPPPWSTLEDSRDAAFAGMGHQRAQEGPAVLDRSSTKGADGVKELMEMVKRRKLTRPDTTTVSRQAEAGTPNSISRNPFRRKNESKDSGNGSTRLRKSIGAEGTTSSRTALSTVSAARQSSMDGGSTKPLKPITGLKIPPLPDGMRPDKPKNGSISAQASSSDGKTTSLNIDGSNRTSKSCINTLDVSVSNKLAKKSTSNLKSTATLQSPLVDLLHTSTSKSVQKVAKGTRISIKASDSIRSKGKSSTSSNKTPAVFDWKGWSNK